MRLQPDQTGGMDHAHDHRLLSRGEAGQIGLGADRGEGLPVDGGAIHFIGVGHQLRVISKVGSASSCAGVKGLSGVSLAVHPCPSAKSRPAPPA
jgi:hypothetical protein